MKKAREEALRTVYDARGRSDADDWAVDLLAAEIKARRDLEDKVLGLGREAKASGGEILADDISGEPHKVPPEVWESATREDWRPPKRLTAAEVETLIDEATENVDALECLRDTLAEVIALRELGNRLALFEEGGKYCRTCSEKSSWDSIKARDPEAQNHAEWCVVPEWLSLVPEDNALPLRYAPGFWGRATARATIRVRAFRAVVGAFKSHALGVPEAFRPNDALDMLERVEKKHGREIIPVPPRHIIHVPRGKGMSLNVDWMKQLRRYAALPADEVPKAPANVSEWTVLDALRFLLDPEPCPGSTMGVVRAVELAKEPDEAYRKHAAESGAPVAPVEDWASSPGGKASSSWTELDALRWVLRWAQVWHKQAGGYMASDTSSGLRRACKLAEAKV